MWLHAAVPARTSDWVVPDSGFGTCAAFSSLWGSSRRRQAYVWEASNCCVQRTLCLKPSIRDSGSCYVKFGAHGLREVQQVAGVVLGEVLSHCRGSCHCSCRRSVVWPDCSACCTCYQPGYRVTLHASLCHPRDRSCRLCSYMLLAGASAVLLHVAAALQLVGTTAFVMLDCPSLQHNEQVATIRLVTWGAGRPCNNSGTVASCHGDQPKDRHAVHINSHMLLCQAHVQHCMLVQWLLELMQPEIH